jgi:hypothetical protein
MKQFAYHEHVAFVVEDLIERHLELLPGRPNDVDPLLYRRRTPVDAFDAESLVSPDLA